MGWSLLQASACSELCHSRASISSMQTLSPPLPAPHGVFRIQLRVPLNLDPRRPHPLQPDPSKSSLPLLLVHSSTINSRIPLIFPLNIPGPLPFPPESSPLALTRVPASPTWSSSQPPSSLPKGTVAPSNLFSMTARQIFTQCPQLRALPSMAPGSG